MVHWRNSLWAAPPELAERPYPRPVVGGRSCPGVLIRDITVREDCQQLSDLFGPPFVDVSAGSVGVRDRRERLAYHESWTPSERLARSVRSKE